MVLKALNGDWLYSRVLWIVVCSASCAYLLPGPVLFGQEKEKAASPDAGDAGHSGEAGAGHQDGEAAEEHAEHAQTDAAEHHDETDLTHANATDQLGSAADIRYDQVLGSILIFLVLFAILAKLAWGPITKGLDQREESIKHMIEGAQRNHEAAAARLREYELRLTAAAEESRAIIGQAQKDAEKAAERIKADAEAAAERERTRAIADIQAAKASALDEVAQRSVDMAVSLAGRIIQKQLNPSDHAKLINDAIEQFPSRN